MPNPGTEHTLIEGTVYRVNSGNYHVQTEQGTVVCKLRGNLKKELIYTTSRGRPRRVARTQERRATDPIAVGDSVQVDAELGIIEAIFPRRSELSRDSPSGRGQHVLVSNLDRLYVVCAAASPAPDFWLLDRFLVIAEEEEIDAALIVNKIDQCAGDEDAVRLAFRAYEKIGYPVFYVAAKRGWGIDSLRDDLRGRISVFAGQSGVGKSSLLNALQPGLTLKTGDISVGAQQGRHTTTSAELLPLDAGGWVADTPGLRQIEFWEVDKDDVVYCFPEFDPYHGACRFANCRHHSEIGCAVRAAVEAGDIDRRRYESYLRMTD